MLLFYWIFKKKKKKKNMLYHPPMKCQYYNAQNNFFLKPGKIYKEIVHPKLNPNIVNCG